MVRAATTGGFDYRGADPYDKQWRMRHSLMLRDINRIAEAQICAAAHDHWLAYASHSNLEAESWDKIKKYATNALKELQTAIAPWKPKSETEKEKDTIEDKYGDLIQQYKEMVAQKAAEREAADKEKNAQKSDK